MLAEYIGGNIPAGIHHPGVKPRRRIHHSGGKSRREIRHTGGMSRHGILIIGGRIPSVVYRRDIPDQDDAAASARSWIPLKMSIFGASFLNPDIG
jgi:hypothetical protein